MMTKQSFEYTGSSTYEINNVVVSNNNIALFDQLTGVGGVDFMPYDGATVIVKAGDSTGTYQDLAPTLNNKLYYHVSDKIYDARDKDTLVNISTEIPVIYSGGEFVGTFVFVNPNDYPYLYLFWNYNDTAEGSTNISYIGVTDERVIDWTLGSYLGVAGINYNSLDTPTRFQIKWNGGIVSDSGYVGLNTLANYNALISAGVNPDDIKLSFPYNGLVNNGNGALRFKKNTDLGYGEIIVSSPIATSTWIINKVNPYLTPFYIDITDGDISNVCTQCPTSNYYHDGFNLTPETGDNIYLDPLGASTYDGNNAYHMVDIVSCAVPSPTNKYYVLVNEDGVVELVGVCNCPETAPPMITQGNIFITVGEEISIPLSSIGSPTSFNLIGSCYNYVLTGGSRSSVFSYTDCNGDSRYISVSPSVESVVCASIAPVLISGDGTATSSGQCFEYTLINGMSFSDSGVLSGTAQKLKDFSFSVTATNCFGTSPIYDINVFVSKGELLTPFSVDVEQYKETASDCCSITPTFSILYFEGEYSVPDLRNRVYKDQLAEEYFDGGNFWYFIDKSDYVIKIDRNGYVVETSVCAGSTTTTSTTSTTTIPVVGNYYEAVSCIDGVTTAILIDVTSAVIVPTNIVKTADGNCWEITSVSPGGFPYFYIENPVVIYADCTTCTGTTTTTTSTTTTTLPPITAFNISPSNPANDAYTACNSAGIFISYYHFGAYTMPLVGDIVYTDPLCTTLFNGGFLWYIANDGVNTYAIHIANTGQVLHISPCSIVTTTTTTTTIPTYYYDAELCTSPGPTYLLAYQSLYPVVAGDIVKGDDGNCYEIITTSLPGVQDANILFIFANCSSCIGTTTTTTSTTTTTTTTTSTTTTTTVKPIYSVLCNYGIESVVCSSPVVTFYTDGPIGDPISGICIDAAFTTPAPANYYKAYTSSVAYEWDGALWTGNIKNC
jgi:hypothetical protein